MENRFKSQQALEICRSLSLIQGPLMMLLCLAPYSEPPVLVQKLFFPIFGSLGFILVLPLKKIMARVGRMAVVLTMSAFSFMALGLHLGVLAHTGSSIEHSILVIFVCYTLVFLTIKWCKNVSL